MTSDSHLDPPPPEYVCAECGGALDDYGCDCGANIPLEKEDDDPAPLDP